MLGLLALRSWTTYELAKQVQKSLSWFWPRAERKLYEEPKRLLDDGLATASRERTGKRPRTVYDITPAGRAALRAWLDEPPAPPTLEDEGMVKVFFADGGSRDQLLVTLGRIAAEAERRRDLLAQMAAGRPLVFPARAHLNAISLRLHRDLEETTLAWARWAGAQVEQWDSAEDPGGWDALAVLDDVATVRTRPRAR